jgi:cell division protein ZapA (FtsZ GTPase activity inhibitor)
MAEMSRVEVEILGQKYAIRSEAPAEYVRELAAYVERRAEEIRGSARAQDAPRLLALTALHIADELFRLRDERAEAERETEARLGALRNLLETIVPEA